jgi:hypothetical protein
MLGLRPISQRAQHHAAGDIQERHDGRTNPRQRRHGGRHPDGNSFRIAQRDLLRHQFADHQGEVRDDRHDEADAERLGDPHAQTQINEPFGETLPERGSGKGAGEDADQGDADLDAREKAARIGCQRQRAPRADDLAVDQRLQSAAPGRDNGEFREREKSVDQDQRDDDRQFDENHRQNIIQDRSRARGLFARVGAAVQQTKPAAKQRSGMPS